MLLADAIRSLPPLSKPFNGRDSGFSEGQERKADASIIQRIREVIGVNQKEFVSSLRYHLIFENMSPFIAWIIMKHGWSVLC